MVLPHTSNGIIPKWKLLFRGAYKWNLVFHLSEEDLKIDFSFFLVLKLLIYVARFNYLSYLHAFFKNA